MSADIVQARYDQLEQIARRLGEQANVLQQTEHILRDRSDILVRGSWQGKGLAAFDAEMNGKTMPALQRLSAALFEAERVTLTVTEVMRAAEDEAAAPFREGNGRSAGPANGGLRAFDDLPAFPKTQGNLFSSRYMDNLVGLEVPGADTPALNRSMEMLAGNPSPAQVRVSLEQIATARGLSLAEVQVGYQRFLQLKAEAVRIQLAKGLDPPPSLHQLPHDQYMGSTTQLRYGKVVGDAMGIDPVFGALLNPTGGLVGAGNVGFDFGDTALGYHGVVHDAAGYLYNYHNLGPGYDYLGQEGRETGNPFTGQEAGIRYWNRRLGSRIGTITEPLGALMGKYVNAETWIQDVADTVAHSIDWGDIVL